MTVNLRVCHLGKYYPPFWGGIETQVRTLAQAQAVLGADVEVFCFNHVAGPTAVEWDGSLRVTRFGRLAAAAKIDFCPELIAGLRRVDADILHLHVPNPTMILALLASRPKASLVVTYHSDVVRQRLRSALFRPLEWLAYRRVAAILPTSPTYAQGSSFLRGYKNRLQILPNGIDVEPFLNPSPADWAEAEHIKATYPGPIWLGCGRLIYYKGFLNAIRALPQVAGTLLLVGKGPDELVLRSEAQRLGVANRVIFLSGVQHIAPYYLAAHAFWFPSNARSEAFGVVQVEAMAAGCPVINAAIPHSGVSWVSLHEQTGLTVPVNDPAALAAAANRLLHEPGLHERLAANGRLRASQEFDHRRMAERSLEIYHRVLEESQKSEAGFHSACGLAAREQRLHARR